MVIGIATATANSILNVYRNTTFTGIANMYVQLHTADPGAAGTTAISLVTTRNAVTWNAASGGSMTLLSLASWAMTGTETLTHLSLWTASTAGTFMQDVVLSTPVPVISGSTFTVTSLTLSYSPLAA